MIIEFDVTTGRCGVMKEAGDRKYHRGYAEPESTFLYDIQQKLKSKGHDVIKKRMWKDGHMVDDTQQYVRSRNTGPAAFCILNNRYALEDAGLEFNKLHYGEVYQLMICRLE